jgi:predicted RNA-binding protein with PUA-like domain
VKTSYWLIKSEPSVYSYAALESERRTAWTGVRNYEARNNLRAMKKGDLCLYYHSNEGKAVVGVAKVVKEAYQDPTTDEDWSAVDVAPVVALSLPVELASVRQNPKLAAMQLLTRSRLSVVPVTAAEAREVLARGKTRLP